MADLTNSPLDIQTTEQVYCRRLRCKEMFIDTGLEFKMHESGSGIYWCSHTQNPLGPDGQAAHHETCKSGRVCFEPV